MYTLLGTLLAVACTYVTAYVLSRPRFKHRFWLMSLFIITWVFDAGIIPQYIIYNQFGFVNNPWVMIVPGAISTQFLIITKTFLEGIPNELEEAAVVDCDTHFSTAFPHCAGNDRLILRGLYLEPVPCSADIFERRWP